MKQPLPGVVLAVLAGVGTAGGGLMIAASIDKIRARDVAAADLADRQARFAAEPDQSLTDIDHPHIVGFRGTGSFAGVNWMAMEFLEGQSLRERIATTGAIPWRESLSIMTQIVDGLGAAQGVVHRDLKPDNVMFATPADGCAVCQQGQ